MKQALRLDMKIRLLKKRLAELEKEKAEREAARDGTRHQANAGANQ